MQKFLLKTNTNLLLVTVVAQFTAKTTNPERAISTYVLFNKETEV